MPLKNWQECAVDLEETGQWIIDTILLTLAPPQQVENA